MLALKPLVSPSQPVTSGWPLLELDEELLDDELLELELLELELVEPDEEPLELEEDEEEDVGKPLPPQPVRPKFSNTTKHHTRFGFIKAFSTQRLWALGIAEGKQDY